MARRRRRYGEVRHSSERVMRAAMRDVRSGWWKPKAKIPVTVSIDRDMNAVGTKGMFKASACIGTRAKAHGKSSYRRQPRCGSVARGSTPSKAFKAALRKLAGIHNY